MTMTEIISKVRKKLSQVSKSQDNDEIRGSKAASSEEIDPRTDFKDFFAKTIDPENCPVPHYLDLIDNNKKEIKNSKEEIQKNEKNLTKKILEKENVQTKMEKELKYLNSMQGMQSNTYFQSKEKLEKFENQFLDIEAKLKERPLQLGLTSWIYWFIILMLSLVEVPINNRAFEFFFKKSLLTSTFCALGAGILIMTSAHFLGLFFKRIKYYYKNKHFFPFLINPLIIITVGMIICFISIAREISFDQALEIGHIFSENPKSIPSQASAILDDTILLLLLNTLIFLTGILLSYNQYDSNPIYEKVYFNIEKTKKKITKISKKWLKKSREIETKYAEEINALNLRIKDIESEIKRDTDKIKEIQDYLAKKHLNLIFIKIKKRINSYIRGYSRCGGNINSLDIPGDNEIEVKIKQYYLI